MAEDIFRSYGPGRYDTYATEYLYELSMNGAGDSCGDVETTNWYGLLEGPFDHPQLRRYAGAILEQNSHGFVYSKLFTSKRALKKKWEEISVEIAKLEDEGDTED